MSLGRVQRKTPQQQEELQQLLYRGGELVAQGKLDEAKGLLERACDLDPKNEKALNLLGMTYFKLGVLDRASEVYEALVKENPVDPTLRVNLGLVYLKNNTLARAVREFETAVDLAPDHKKAHNYLGLALAQAGEFGRAREHFVTAGSEAMAQKMAKALADGAAAPVAEKPRASSKAAPAKAPEAPAPHELPPEEAVIESEVEAGEPQRFASLPGPVERTNNGQLEGDWGAQFGMERAAGSDMDIRFAEDEGPSAPPIDQPIAPAEAKAEITLDEGMVDAPDSAPRTELRVVAPSRAAPASPPAAAGSSGPRASTASAAVARPTTPGSRTAPALDAEPARTPAHVPVPLSTTAVPLAELASAVRLTTRESLAPFLLSQGVAVISVKDELFCRLEGLSAISGTLSFKPESRRFRGRPIDKLFGDGASTLHRVTGTGGLTVETGRFHFVAVGLGEQAGYFREEAVFAFEESLTFENGQIPSQLGAEVRLVHLSGEGQALLKLGGPLRSLEVRMKLPVTVPLGRWVGWYGNLTPRIVPLPFSAPGEPEPAVELSGEGMAFVAGDDG